MESKQGDWCMTKHIGFKRSKVPAFTSERKDEYAAEEAKYFRNLGDAKRPGLSAADAAVADRHLPSKEQEHRILEHWETNLTKASRSGAFSKPNVGPAIFPQGIKKTMSFIDSVTPGQYKQQEQRPVLREQTRKVDVPPSEATVLHICLECLEPVDQNDAANMVIAGFFAYPFNIITQQPDGAKLFAMGIPYWGAPMLGAVHLKCETEARAKMRDKTPIVLIRGSSNLTDPDDLARAARYGMIQQIHDGEEVSMGSFYERKRQEKLGDNFTDILVVMPKDSLCYRKNRLKAQERGEAVD
jgi:hypothetical protein